MTEAAYRELLAVMQKRGGSYAGLDIPEFFNMVEELFTPQQAEMNNALPQKPATAARIAELVAKSEAETEEILESMADSGLCSAHRRDGTVYYGGAIFMPGILEWQFLPGKTTERDKKKARLIDAYKKAHDAIRPLSEATPTFAGTRVITVDRTIDEDSTVHTYDQVKTYIEKNDLIGVAACYCRHKAVLLEEDTHGMPIQVCMSFGPGVDFMVERLGGRKLTKEEAIKLLDETEAAGLVHMTTNVTDNINFMCNCDRWHCVHVTGLLEQSKPGKFFNSGFEPRFDPAACVACETCIDRCPSAALAMADDDLPVLDLDRCFGCAVCATGCPSEAITMVNKPDFPEPPRDHRALGEAFRAGRSS